MTKPFVKDAAGHFRNLVEHAFKPYEPSPVHLLKRLIAPLCFDISHVLSSGTAADAKETLELFERECRQLRRTSL